MNFKWGALLLILLFLSALYAKDSASSPARTQVLQAALQEAKCRADLTAGYLDAVAKAVPNATGLQDDSSRIRADIASLESDASGADSEGYQNRLHSSFDSDLRAAREKLARRPWKDSDNDTLSSIKSSYQSLVQAYQSCQASARKSYAQNRVTVYQNELNAYSNRAQAAGKSGIDTSGMQAVISGAQSQIVSPLQAAVNSASNASGLEQALKSYCLFNGCANGTNYHLAAKFEAARLQATLNYLLSKAGNESGYYAQAQSDLAAAQATLASIGTSDYRDNGSSELFGQLRQVSKDIKQAQAQIRQASAKAMAERRAAMMGNRTNASNRANERMRNYTGPYNKSRMGGGTGSNGGGRLPVRPVPREREGGNQSQANESGG